ncbi:hypothetical protein EFM11_02360 [Lactobacillus helveticus]|nr:hypothetical protein [Lactobacillus helveticus]MCT0164401.1 hypothetical protein [Lactobacillus helveticus]
MNPDDNKEAIIPANDLNTGSAESYISDDMKRMVPFKITVKLKTEVMHSIKVKVGDLFEIPLKGPYHYEGNVTKIEGNKITVEGEEPLIQAINLELENVDTMKDC